MIRFEGVSVPADFRGSFHPPHQGALVPKPSLGPVGGDVCRRWAVALWRAGAGVSPGSALGMDRLWTMVARERGRSLGLRPVEP